LLPIFIRVECREHFAVRGKFEVRCVWLWDDAREFCEHEIDCRPRLTGEKLLVVAQSSCDRERVDHKRAIARLDSRRASVNDSRTLTQSIEIRNGDAPSQDLVDAVNLEDWKRQDCGDDFVECLAYPTIDKLCVPKFFDREVDGHQ
jgi:hypothetical protein